MPTTPERSRRLYLPVRPLSTWSVDGVRSALRQHEDGDLRRSALLAEHMERNPRIFAALQTRVLGALGLPFELEVDEDADGRSGESVRRLVAQHWYEIAPEEVVSDLLRWAVLLGVAFAEIVWRPQRGREVPELIAVHPSLVRWDDTAAVWVVQTERGEVVIEAGTGRWIVLGYTRQRPWMRGVVRCLGLEDKIRIEAVRDWARWSERHGAPLLVAKTPATASDEDCDAFFDGLRTIGAGGTTVLAPQGEGPQSSFGVELVEAKTAEAAKGFQALLEFVASDASIAILGQNLTQETNGGSLAAARVHERVRADYLEADTALLSTCLRRDVLAPWCEFNGRARELAPWPVWDAAPPEDTATVAAGWKAAADAVSAWRAVGVNVDVAEAARRAGIPLGQPVLIDEPAPANEVP